VCWLLSYEVSFHIFVHYILPPGWSVPAFYFKVFPVRFVLVALNLSDNDSSFVIFLPVLLAEISDVEVSLLGFASFLWLLSSAS